MLDRRAFLLGSVSAAALMGLPAAPMVLASTKPTTAGGTWRSCTRVPWKVQEVYATILNGRIYIAGGMIQVPGESRPRAIDRVGIYDPATDSWQAGPNLPQPRHHPLLVTVGEDICAIGGASHEGAGGHWHQRREVFILSAGQWRQGTPLPEAQSEGVALKQGNQIHLISGRTGKTADANTWADQRDVDTHRVFDLTDRRWRLARPVPGGPRNSATGGVIDGRLYIAGGRTMADGNMDRLDCYDPSTDRWETLAPMPYPAGGLAGAVLGERLYVFGGEKLGKVEGPDGVIGNAWRYDPRKDRWEALANMPTPRHGLAAAAVGQSVFAIGGGALPALGDTTDKVEAFSLTGP